jgi:hypothetical protein
MRGIIKTGVDRNIDERVKWQFWLEVNGYNWRETHVPNTSLKVGTWSLDILDFKERVGVSKREGC